MYLSIHDTRVSYSELWIEFYLLIIDSLIDDFSQRFDKKSMQLFHLASQFIKYAITFILDSLLLLSKSFTINLAPLKEIN